MGMVSALVGTIAGLLSIFLKIKELKKTLGDVQTKSQTCVLDSNGKPIIHTSSVIVPSMIVPALALTFFVQILVMSAIIPTQISLYLNADSTLVNDKELLKVVSDLLLNSTGFTIIGISFPLLVVMSYKRAFMIPKKCFSRGLTMGIWSGIFIGIIELIGELIKDGKIITAMHQFILKFIVYLCYGFICGLIFIIVRKIRNSHVSKKLIGAVK